MQLSSTETITPSKELTLVEKILLIENGSRSAAQVHQDPNPNMAFTRFAGPDPGATPEDEDYNYRKPKRPLEHDLQPPTKPRKRLKQVTTSLSQPSSPRPRPPPSADKLKLWQDDEIIFVLERYAEYPEIGNTELAFLVNEEFRDQLLPGGDGVETRGDRSRQSLWQRFSRRGTVDTLIGRLNEQRDVDPLSAE